jgi:small GTP-binding protein
MDENIKLIVVGDNGVGKTHFVACWAGNDNIFNEYAPTVFDNYNYNYKFEEKGYLFEIWDTNCQEEYDRLRPLSYPEANLVFICFKVTNIKSFENVKKKWLEEIRFHLNDIPIVLVGLQIDWRDDEDCIKKLNGVPPISYEQGLNLSKEIDSLCYCENSAKKRTGLEETFKKGFESYIKKYIYKKDKHVRVHHNCLLM